LYWYFPKDNSIGIQPYTSLSLLRTNYGVYLCRGQGDGDLVEYVLYTAKGGYCLGAQEAVLNTEAALFDDIACRTVDDNQRWYIYRDATNPNTIGLQLKRNGFMIGQNRVADGEDLRLFSTGVVNGAGTYHLEPLP
jgi:hypothetical protein